MTQTDSYVPRPGSTGLPAKRGIWTPSDVESAIEAIRRESPRAWAHLQELETETSSSGEHTLDGAIADDVQLGNLARLHPSASFMEIADLAWLIRLSRREGLGLTTAKANLSVCKSPLPPAENARKYYPTRQELTGRGLQLAEQAELCLLDTHLEQLHTKGFRFVVTDLILYEARLGPAKRALAIDTWLQSRAIPVEVHEATKHTLSLRRNDALDLDPDPALCNRFKNWGGNVIDRRWKPWEVEETFHALAQMYPKESKIWRDQESRMAFDFHDPRMGYFINKGIALLHPEAFLLGDTELFGQLREHMHAVLKQTQSPGSKQ